MRCARSRAHANRLTRFRKAIGNKGRKVNRSTKGGEKTKVNLDNNLLQDATGEDKQHGDKILKKQNNKDGDKYAESNMTKEEDELIKLNKLIADKFNV